MLDKSTETLPRRRTSTQSSSSSSSSTVKRGKVARNRTILGSFPLFYKLSQSLGSLNLQDPATLDAAQGQAQADPGKSKCDKFQEETTNERYSGKECVFVILDSSHTWLIFSKLANYCIFAQGTIKKPSQRWKGRALI